MCCFSQLYYMQKDRCKSVPMIPHIDLLISPWFVIRITWSLHCWIALIKYCLSYTNHHFPFVVIDKLFSKISESTKHWDTFATHCTGPCSLRDDISLYTASTIILKIFFVTGLTFLLLSLHHTHPLTLLAIFLILLTILLFKALCFMNT